MSYVLYGVDMDKPFEAFDRIHGKPTKGPSMKLIHVSLITAYRPHGPGMKPMTELNLENCKLIDAGPAFIVAELTNGLNVTIPLSNVAGITSEEDAQQIPSRTPQGTPQPVAQVPPVGGDSGRKADAGAKRVDKGSARRREPGEPPA